MTAAHGPLRVVLTRNVVESVHLVDAVVSTTDHVEELWGGAEARANPRSAIKFIQSIPLVRTGAANAFDVSDRELALAVASHSGEPAHTEAVASWLARLGLSESDLECGPDQPLGRDAALALATSGHKPGQLHNCCSGKHAGFLTVARHLGIDIAGYIQRDHPVQQLVTAAIEEFVGVNLSDASNGLDGCGIPTFSFLLRDLAAAMARYADPAEPPHPPGTRDAVARLRDAIAPNTWWMSGTDRHEVRLVAAATEPILLKGGAEGVFMGLVPGRGLGIALKAHDGADRAAGAAMGGLLEHLGIVPSGTSRSMLSNRAGTEVGEMFVEL